MSMLTSDASGLLQPDYGSLITDPVTRMALALDPRVSTLATTGSTTYHLPILREDAGASWVAEGAELSSSDAVFDELVITPAKVGGTVPISRELAEDSSPTAATEVGNGLARAIAAQIDAAYFGALAAPAPQGLGTLTTQSTVTGELTSGDVFLEAIAEAETVGATPTIIVMNPLDALTLAKVKVSDGSVMPLLSGATEGAGRTVAGLPIATTTYVPQGTAWALDATRNHVIMRDDVRVEVDRSVYFNTDRVAVKATLRAGFGFPTPKTAVKITFTAPAETGE